MVTSPINDPKHWRERAEEARVHDEQITDPESKEAMLRIAEDYEKTGEARRRTAAKFRRGHYTLAVGFRPLPLHRARTLHPIPPFHVAMFVLFLLVLPFILKWFFTGSTYGIYP